MIIDDVNICRYCGEDIWFDSRDMWVHTSGFKSCLKTGYVNIHGPFATPIPNGCLYPFVEEPL